MPAAPSRPATPNRKPSAKARAGKPFEGLIEAVLLKERGDFEFDGAIAQEDAAAAWTWVLRDLAADLIDPKALDESDPSRGAVEALMPELIERALAAADAAAHAPELGHRLIAQLGGEEARARLPYVIAAMRCRGLFEKAQGFGRAANGLGDEAGLTLALQSLIGTDQSATPFLMFAMVGQMAQPMRLVSAAIRSAGEPTEPALVRTGFAPLIDAILAHAQDQIPVLTQVGTFGDMDLVCRAVDRYHRLMRAVTGLIELTRGGTWARIAATLTKHVSDKLDPKLRDVAPDVNKSLRKRDGIDRVDSDQVLSALNGMYLLATIRDCRDSLALNTLFDQVWTQVGQALEIHIDRLLDALRAKPSDAVASARLDAALKMAAIRFGQEYADTLRRAKETTVRRVSS